MGPARGAPAAARIAAERPPRVDGRARGPAWRGAGAATRLAGRPAPRRPRAPGSLPRAGPAWPEHLLCCATPDGRQRSFVWARPRPGEEAELTVLGHDVGS